MHPENTHTSYKEMDILQCHRFHSFFFFPKSSLDPDQSYCIMVLLKYIHRCIYPAARKTGYSLTKVH